MTQTQAYQAWKPTVLGKVIGDGQCVSLVVNNPASYVEHLWPGVNWETIIKPVPSAKDLDSAANSTYLQWIANDVSDPNQLPQQGDIMVFGATPAAGHTDMFDNPDGHCGVCDSASASGYVLCQQNAPNLGQSANATSYPWNFRPCLGWLRPVLSGSTPAPAPAPAPVQTSTGKTITLPKTTGPWHLYKIGGPYVPADALGLIEPEALGRDLTYNIVEDLGNGVYVIDSTDYGRGALWTKGSDVIVK